MAIEPTVSAVNVEGSLKRYFVDELETGLGHNLTFDISLLDPDLQDATITSWFVINFGSSVKEGFSNQVVEIYCCTRKDPEGYKLSELTDDVYEKLIDTSKVDGKRRITFYSVMDWTAIGSLVVERINDSGKINAPDGTKYRMLTCQIIWVARA